MRRTLTILAFLFSARAVEAQSDTATSAIARELTEMQRAIAVVMQKQPVDLAAYSAIAEKNRARVAELIARDELRTAADFLGASMLAGEPTGFYESRRVEHELALTALALGHPGAMKRVALTWDALNWSLGRGQRIGTMMRNGVPNNMDPVPAPAVIRDVFKDLPAARQRAAEKTNNAELERMRNEDQADREDPIDMAKLNRMRVNDPVRRERTLKLVADGVPVTARDFHNAAVVLQHGETPDDFRLTHELTIAAVALGDTSAVWLLSRSYDRMLLSMGHRQRMNTQYGGASTSMLPLDTTAVNDRIRVALGSRRLADSAKPPGA